MNEPRQAFYTSVQEGPAGNAGFQFVAASPGFEPTSLPGIERLLGYRPPEGSSPSPDADEIARFPVSRVFERLESGEYVFILTRYLGRDYSGRFGNYFAHVVAIDRRMAPIGMRPIDVFELDWWRRSGEAESRLPKLEFPSGVTRADWRPASTEAQSRTLASAIGLMVDQKHTLYIEDHEPAVTNWLELCYAVMPEFGWWDLTFTTYAADAVRAPGRIKATDPAQSIELQAYELRSTASLVSSVRESSGPTNPFGRITGSLIAEADSDSLDSLTGRIRKCRLPLTGDVMDAIAIASDGDPDLHDLSEDDLLATLQVVLQTGDEMFTVRHVGWIFAKLSPARSVDVAGLFEESISLDSGLAREIGKAAFGWLLENHDPSSGILRTTIGSMPAEWAEVWLEALGRSAPEGYARLLDNGLALSLATRTDQRRDLGAEIASGVVSGRTSIDVLSEVGPLPGEVIEGIVDFALSAELAETATKESFSHATVKAEVRAQMSDAGDIDRLLGLWKLARAIEVEPDDRSMERMTSLASSPEDAEAVLGAVLSSESGSFEIRTCLVRMCADCGISPGQTLMDDFEAGLLESRPLSREDLRELYSGLGRAGVRTDVGKAIQLTGLMPGSATDMQTMVKNASCILRGSTADYWKQEVANHVGRMAASVEDPRGHLELVREVSAYGEPWLELAYSEEMRARLSRRKEAELAGALIFLTWNEPGRSPLNAESRDRRLMALSEKQRSGVEAYLSRNDGLKWDAWCKRNPPKGRFARRRAR